MNPTIAASAPGKIILSGEHFVVHGSYAVAAATNKRVYVSIRKTGGAKSRIVSEDRTSNLSSDDGSFPAVKSVARSIVSKIPYGKNDSSFDISIKSEIPPGSGLGSSAAVSVACAAALNKFFELSLDPKDISNAAFLGERVVHGNPSGLDIQASLLGGLILFRRNFDPDIISVENPFSLLVIFSGTKRSTSKLIAKVARRKSEHPNYFRRLIDSASNLSLEVSTAAKIGDFEKMGSLFTIAQTDLSWIGVSTPQIDDLIDSVLGREDVLGAKLTGAGGGGSIIAAIKPGTGDALIRLFSHRYPSSFITEIPQEGVRWEKTEN